MKNERENQEKIRLIQSDLGGCLWRNNVGVMIDKRGIPVRYGLANESARMNSMSKSSDLIGITPTVITESMVGMTLGIFTAVEVKSGNWKYRGTPREEAQNKFLEVVCNMGGIGYFYTGVDCDVK